MSQAVQGNITVQPVPCIEAFPIEEAFANWWQQWDSHIEVETVEDGTSLRAHDALLGKQLFVHAIILFASNTSRYANLSIAGGLDNTTAPPYQNLYKPCLFFDKIESKQILGFPLDLVNDIVVLL